MIKEKSKNEFYKYIKEQRPDIELLEDYKGSKSKIKVRCKKCGNECTITPERLYQDYQCAKCNKEKRRAKSEKEYRDYVKKNYKDIDIVGDYINASTKIKMHCKKCGYDWLIAPAQFKTRKGCPKCLNKIKKTHEEFYNELKECNPDIILLTKYNGANNQISCKCKRCGKEWTIQYAKDLLHGHGCPSCCHTGTSYLEQIISETFKTKLGDKEVLQRDKKTIGKELDIYIPSIRLAIEPGGWYWHKRRLKQDSEKVVLCKENDIKLIIIYDNFNENTIPFENCIVTEYDLGVESNEKHLRTLLDKLLKEFNIEPLSDLEFKNIKQKAIRNSKRMTTDDFKKELEKINPDLKIIGDYSKKHSKVQVQCKKCGYIRFAQAKSLLTGIGCPNCSGVRKKTHEEFISELKSLNENIIVLSRYESAHKKVKCKCSKCGNEWFATPRHLLDGRKCPNCSKKEGSRKRIETYIKEHGSLLDNNPELCKDWSDKNANPPSLYTANSGEKVWWKCSTCGREWQAKIVDRNRGRGCSNCSRNDLKNK